MADTNIRKIYKAERDHVPSSGNRLRPERGGKKIGPGTTEDEMVGWHHRLDGHELEQAPGVGDGQGSLACCSPWGCNGSDVERLN